MFFNGLSRTARNGNVDYLPNPYIEGNLAFSFQLQIKAQEYYPGFTRHIYLQSLRYNLHLKPRALLIEAGSQLNTVEEEKNAMEPLADILDRVLAGRWQKKIARQRQYVLKCHLECKFRNKEIELWQV